MGKKKIAVLTYFAQPVNVHLLLRLSLENSEIYRLFLYCPSILPKKRSGFLHGLRIALKKIYSWYVNFDVLSWIVILRYASRIRFYSSVTNLKKTLIESDIDLIIFIAGEIIPRDIYLSKKTIIYHCGPLPRYRGSNVGFWQLFNLENEFRGSVLYAEDPVDSGNVILEDGFPITYSKSPRKMLREVNIRQAKLGGVMLKDVLRIFDNGGNIDGEKQSDVDEDVFYKSPTRSEIRLFEKKINRLRSQSKVAE